MLNIKRVIASAPKKPTDVDLEPLSTPWSDQAKSEDTNTQNHPHPQFARTNFQLLDGWWDYCILPSENAAFDWQTSSTPAQWEGQIRVPFSPEAPLSGVNRQLKPTELLWYRRTFSCPEKLRESKENRCILHFEAIDYACACYCNGTLIGTHTGGYLPFSFDITNALAQNTDEAEIVVCVYDPSDTGVQLRGKQKLERGGIWYTAQSGIWQSVWLEVVPAHHIVSLSLDADADAGQLKLDVTLSVCKSQDVPLEIKILDAGETICIATTDIPASTYPSTHSIMMDVPNPHLWSPEDPHLYQLELTYGDDAISSYCAFRSVTMEPEENGISRLNLNHKPIFLRGVLDQGYWPDGLMTAPSDDALVFDIEAMKELGFNMLRKHIKIESDRWYYHCDRLGMLVWQDMVCGGSVPKPWYVSYKPTFFRSSWGRYNDNVSHYQNLASESEDFRNEWTETCIDTISYLRNHPSVITWVLFNEAWGQFDAVKATDMVRILDPNRPIDAVSGWYDQSCGDFLSVHNYFRPLEVYGDSVQPKRAFVISEFGGLSYHIPKHSSLASSYGYESYSDITSFQEALREILSQADDLETKGLAGYVYTQLSDVEEETNGILSYDRRINKLDSKDFS